jgi:hypothetical protein
MMNKETFKNELLSDWENNLFKRFEQFHDDPNFLKLNEIRSLYGLYDLFYPLGIHGNSLTDTCHVFSEIMYQCEHDFNLSVVLAETCFTYLDRKSYHKDIFVMTGYYNELSIDDVAKFALTHCAERTLESFKAVRFNYNTLDLLLTLKDEFLILK